MPDDPHRDALAAALARIDALEQENRALRDQPGTVPRPPSPPAQPAASNDVVEHAIDDTLRQLSERLDAQIPEHAPRAEASDDAPKKRPAKMPAKCGGCGGARTVEARLERKALVVSFGVEEVRVARARVCADCGHVALVLDERSRLWLDANFLSAMLAEND